LTDQFLAGYRMTLQEDRRFLFDRFTLVDVVRQVVGVGSVGMRVYLALFEGRSGSDPLFLQIKQAGASVYESYLGRSRHDNHGARVIAGKRALQSATGIFVGWGSFQGRDYYVRQFRDMKIILDIKLLAPLPGRVRCRLWRDSGAGPCPLGRRRGDQFVPRQGLAVRHCPLPLCPCLRRPERARPRATRARHRRGYGRECTGLVGTHLELSASGSPANPPKF
jgi:hypothetical protein